MRDSTTVSVSLIVDIHGVLNDMMDALRTLARDDRDKLIIQMVGSRCRVLQDQLRKCSCRTSVDDQIDGMIETFSGAAHESPTIARSTQSIGSGENTGVGSEPNVSLPVSKTAAS